MTENTTLQINLSPGDISYAYQTVLPLIDAHKNNVSNVLLVVDCCRPQKTKIVNPDVKFPKSKFRMNAKKIVKIANKIKIEKKSVTLFILDNKSDIYNHISKKYLGGIIDETHAFGGTALMSYFAGLEIPQSRYIIHYDGDMILHQKRGYDWSVEAIEIMKSRPNVVAATPRISPPFANKKNTGDAPSLHPGRALTPDFGGWKDDWFSTRCFLIDKDKLSNFLPLIEGKELLRTLFWKALKHRYPRDVEIMLFRRIRSSDGWRLNLSSEKAWLLHPDNKSDKFLKLLPEIQHLVSLGKVPNKQRGYADINVQAWERFIKQKDLR